jgi:Protein of unknown function (DUF4242)
MPVYMVERILPGATVESVRDIQRAAEEACGAFAADGNAVRYLQCTFVPGESRCRCLFEAASGDLVQQMNDTAQIPYSRIMLAIELPSTRPSERPP